MCNEPASLVTKVCNKICNVCPSQLCFMLQTLHRKNTAFSAQVEANTPNKLHGQTTDSFFFLKSASKCTPRHNESNPPKVRRGFTFDVQNVRRATTRPTRQKSADGSLSMFKMHAAPTQPAKSPQRVHFRCSKCAPRHDESSQPGKKAAAAFK